MRLRQRVIKKETREQGEEIKARGHKGSTFNSDSHKVTFCKTQLLTVLD